MKLTTLALVSAAAFAVSANAATLTVFNLTGSGDDLAFLDNSGAPLAGGFLGLYAFGAGDGAPPADVAAAIANGDNGLLNNTVYGGANQPTPGAVFAGLGFANPGPTNGAGQFDGQNLYLMIGDGADAASSTSLALINLGVAPGGSDAPPPGWNGGQIPLSGASNVIFGEVGPTTIDFTNAIGNPAYDTAGLRLAVPEPSTSLLAGLAGLALIIRRKR